MGVRFLPRSALGAPFISAWSPLRLGSALLCWLDAGYPLTLSGGAVQTWTDIAAGYAFTQGVSASRPAFGAASFNGGPGVTFDGVDDGLTLASQPFPSGANSCEIWALADQTTLVADAGSRTVFAYGGNSSNTARSLRKVVSGGTIYAAAPIGTGAGATTVLGPASDWAGRAIVRAQIGAANTTVSKAGSAGTATAAAPSTGSTRACIGYATTDTPAAFWQGIVASILVTAALSADQAAALTTYLQRRL